MLFGQLKSPTTFGKHLIDEGYYKEAILYLNEFDESNNVSLRDSIHFLLGKANFYDKNFAQSQDYFKLVSLETLREPSLIYFSLAELYQNNFNKTHRILSSLSSNDLTSLITKGDFILSGKLDSARSTSVHQSNYIIRKHNNDLDKTIERMETYKRKSPFLAATFSAIVPGAGKFYSGKVGEGVASLLMVGILTASSIEQYNNGGFSNPQFYLMALPGLFFYVGGIYGSYFSVNVANVEFENKVRNEVLFHLHIPFKSIYRQ